MQHLGYKFIYSSIQYKKSQYEWISIWYVLLGPDPEWQLPFASASICRAFPGNLAWLISRHSLQFFSTLRSMWRALSTVSYSSNSKGFWSNWDLVSSQAIPWTFWRRDLDQTNSSKMALQSIRFCRQLAKRTKVTLFMIFKKQRFYVSLHHFKTNQPRILRLH